MNKTHIIILIIVVIAALLTLHKRPDLIPRIPINSSDREYIDYVPKQPSKPEPVPGTEPAGMG